MKKVKIAVALLVVVAMLAACGGNGGGGGADAGTIGAVQGGGAGAPAAVTPGGDDRIVVTTGLQATAVQQFFDGDTYEHNRWTRLIYDRLGIHVDVVFTQDATTDAYSNWMNLLLATGDLPDVVRHDDINWLVQAQAAGHLMDITDVFEREASPAVQHYRNTYPLAFQGVTFNNRLYGFPFINDTFHQATYLWLRDDWLEYAGGQPPRTVDEMVEMARLFTNGNPSGTGINTFGFGLSRDLLPGGGFGSISGLIGAFGVPAGPAQDGIFYRRDGRITFSLIQPEVRYALEILRDMFAEGLINPEFVAMDIDAFSAGISEGRYGMMYHRNWGTWFPFNLSFQSEGVVTRPYPAPSVPGRELRLGIGSNIGGEYFVISANAPHPEAIIHILNLYNDIIVDFEDENYFIRYWENEQYRLAPIFIGIPTELHAPVVFQANIDGGANVRGMARRAWQQVFNFEAGSDAPDAFGTWGQMNTQGEFGGSMSIALNYYRPRNALVENIMAVERPDIWTQNASILQTMMETTFTDIIIGNQPLDAFDTFVDQWLAAGGQATLDAMEILYPAN
jgi:putative aldouronate transport system substrate-binding protein